MASGFKKLLEQIHHRSLWQTAVAYAAGCWVLLGGVDLFEGVVGLPSWVIRGVAVICVAVFPLVLATAFIQKKGIGGPELVTGAPEKGLRRWFSWRNVFVVASGALAVMAAGTSGYMGLRVMGIGPMGTLIAKGVLPDTTRVVVAELEGTEEEPNLGSLISVALRADLSNSGVLRVVHPEDELRPLLETMRVPRYAAMTDSMARIAAVRAGIPGVVTGEVVEAGGRFVIDLRLVDPENGTVLLQLAEHASSADDLLGSEEHPGAVSRLSGRLLERIGEGFRSIGDRPPLPAVTTGSLEALRLYSEALSYRRPGQRDGEKSVALLREAVAVDSTFGMAWRFLGMSAGVLGDSAADAAMTRAYELRDRLSDRERLDVIGTYFMSRSRDLAQAADAYQRLVARYPDHENGWNNLGQCWYRLGEHEKYREATLRHTALWPGGSNGTINQWEAGLILRDTATAWEALRLAREYGRWVAEIPYREGITAVMAGDREQARRHFEEGLEWAREEGNVWYEAYFYLTSLGVLDAMEGRRASFRERFTEAGELLADRPYPWPELHQAWIASYDVDALRRPEARTEARDALLAVQARLDPSAPPDMNLAQMFAQYGGEPDRAREILEDFEAQIPEGREPNRTWRMRMRGFIALAEGRVEEGLAHFRRAVEADKMTPWPVAELALAYDRLEMPDSALAAFQRYVDGPYFPLGRFDSEAFQLHVTYERLGQLYEERGDLEKAAKYHALFVELWADADPELQPRVQAAREALERIQGRVEGG